MKCIINISLQTKDLKKQEHEWMKIIQIQHKCGKFNIFLGCRKDIFEKREKIYEMQMIREFLNGCNAKGISDPLKTFCSLIFTVFYAIYNLSMFFKFLTLLVVFSGTAVYSIGVSPCPIANHNGTIHSGMIVVAGSGIVPLINGQDSQCYNYSLPYAFIRVPQIAIAVHDFDSDPSNNIFYYIKNLRTDSLAFVPFVIRTQWAYTQWTQISFSFLAEDRADFQSGYFQVDSGVLAGCNSGKEINVLMPFRSDFLPSYQIKYNLFLHGFQITTMPFSSNRRSPYELQIGQSSVNTSGITVTLSVTTITQVNSIYVSYVAYQEPKLKIIYGSYIYDPTNGQGLIHAPLSYIPRNYARLYGITGLIINYNQQRFIFATEWTGHQFHFGLGSSEHLVQYLTYEYIFFAGSECEDCPGYPISYNGTCVNTCPPNTFLTPENVCLSCGEGRYWNGTACAVSCPKGQYLNPVSQKCECPPTLNWNGERCIPCTAGKVFSQESMSCECPRPLKWNGFACARLPDCQNGQVWDVYTYSCQCPEHQYWASNRCRDIPICTDGRILNSRYQCVCPDGTLWNGQRCTYSPCSSTQVWDGSKCLCPAGRNFNGSVCLECINGQQWNQQKKVCECPGGYQWNGQFCNKTYDCSGNRIWNETFKQCVCADGEYWNGRSCIVQPICHGGQFWNSRTFQCLCPGGSKWNTTDCVRCRNGQIWDEPSRTCVCPRGTIWMNNLCRVEQKCEGGMMWNQNIWACECPSATVWNGNYCISNPCSNGRVWNDTHRSCVCSNNKIWDGKACLPPKIACTNGRLWDPSVFACVCPAGTFPSVSKCDQIPMCRNGQVYNPLNNKCECPYGLIFQRSRCVEPSCVDGQFWNGHSCEVIKCPPLSYFENHKCVYKPTAQDGCPVQHYWNGNDCLYHSSVCPHGTQWSGSLCQASGSCQSGYYQNSEGHCVALPQQCVPPTVWTGTKCSASNNNCPEGSYYSGMTCNTYVPCQNGHIWDDNLFICTCPPGQQSNGNRCIECGGGKEWITGIGCRCGEGTFDLGSKCERVDQNRCLTIPKSRWMNGMCECKEGFTKIGLQCVCYGIEIGDYCDRCSQKPNSQWNGYFCQCSSGYTQIDNQCLSNTASTVGTDNPNSCVVGSYFDSNHRKCVACPPGCLSCVDCYTCVQCQPEFNFDAFHNRCIEKCGDGKRYVLECDDGNNQDGDGCSRDCYVETGYTCKGGSPDSADNCFTFQVGTVTLSQSGQIRMPTSIILNLRLDYMPKTLLQSADCKNKCLNILIGEIVRGDSNVLSITSEYIPGSSYSFSMEIEFGRNYMGEFEIQVKIDPAIGRKYFGNVSANQMINITVNPAFLSEIDNRDALE